MNEYPHGTQREEIADLGPLADLQTVEAEEFIGWKPDWARESPALPGTPPSVAAGADEPLTLEPLERRLLQVIVQQPDKPSSHYPKLAGTSHRKALLIRKRLIERGMLREEEVNIKARGRASILLTPTDRALQALKTVQDGSNGEHEEK